MKSESLSIDMDEESPLENIIARPENDLSFYP